MGANADALKHGPRFACKRYPPLACITRAVGAAGTVAYTSVITAQTIAFSDAQTLLNIRQNRLSASVVLIEALGGGWNAASLGQSTGTAAELTAQEAQARGR